MTYHWLLPHALCCRAIHYSADDEGINGIYLGKVCCCSRCHAAHTLIFLVLHVDCDTNADPALCGVQNVVTEATAALTIAMHKVRRSALLACILPLPIAAVLSISNLRTPRKGPGGTDGLPKCPHVMPHRYCRCNRRGRISCMTSLSYMLLSHSLCCRPERTC